eukprot:TRINITY_DN186_c0_g1_i3.p1 TRINITY_DN186_c0_g1~~TRINITY_DN186_c0_g1_i3.p1  ORF type:complete len:773 (+),score=181.90 TRINITY_DN186_c0_g1_i3:126-2444(+)
MKLCVEWNRGDILKEVLKPSKKSNDQDPQDHQSSLNEAFQKALTLNRSEIFSLLLQHGAQVSKVDLVSLYRSRRGENLLNTFADDGPKDEEESKARTNPETEEEVKEPQDLSVSQIFGNVIVDPASFNFDDVMKNRRPKFPGKFMNALNKFEEMQFYVKKTTQSNDTSTTDLLVWAVFSQKDTLAFEIWMTHDFSLHAALLIAYIYGELAARLPSRKKELEELHAQWEEVSYRVLDRITTPEIAHSILEATWPEMMLDGVKLAVKAEAKSVVSHSYFQKVLDQRLYESDRGILEVQTSNLRVVMIILFPFLFMTFLRNPFREKTTEEHALITPELVMNSARDDQIISPSQENSETQDLLPPPEVESDGESATQISPLTRSSLAASQLSLQIPIQGTQPKGEDNPWSWAVYSVPIVKLWTKNLAYVLYLTIVSIVALSDWDYKISVIEYILAFWVIALISDEFYEYHENPEGHFDTITNKLDFSILMTWVVYYILRIMAAIFENDTCNEVAVYLICLIVVAGCLRAMQIFQLNPVIGPLLLMINKMANDVVRFFGMFLLLFIGSQVSMISVARNIGTSEEYEDEYADNWKELYPKGVQMLTLWGFVGEFSFDALKEWPVGYVLLAVYIMFAGVMMQNLLIAMMADSYQQVNENAESEWKFERFFLVEEQQSASSVPPPFNIFEVFWAQFCAPENETEEERDLLSEPELLTLKQRLNLYRSEYLESRIAKEKKSLSNRSDSLNSRLENLHTKRIEDREYMDRRFKELKGKISRR